MRNYPRKGPRSRFQPKEESSHFQVSVLAGTDIWFSGVIIVEYRAHQSPRATLLLQLRSLLQPRLLEEFGPGATLRQLSRSQFNINVDRVQTEDQQ